MPADHLAGCDLDRVDGTGFDALATAIAHLRVDVADPVAADDRVADVEGADAAHHATTAAAAVADIANAVLDVVSGLGQPGLFAIGQQLHRFGGCQRLSDAVAHQHLRTVVEGHAGAHRLVAGRAQVAVVVAARAERDRMRRGRLDNMAGPLPVQNLHVVAARQRFLPHQRAPDLRLAGEDRAREAVVLEEILVEQSRQFCHRHVVTRAHEGVLEETDDDRREGEIALAVAHHVQHEPALSHRRQLVIQPVRWNLQLARQAIQRDKRGWHLAGDVSFPRREEQLENLCEHRRLRCAGHIAIEPLLQELVGAVLSGEMSHGGAPWPPGEGDGASPRWRATNPVLCS